MSGTKFTPWPWEVDGNTVYALHRVVGERGAARMVNRFWATVKLGPDCSPEEATANANLISAAPDLYEALAALVEHADAMERCDFYGEEVTEWQHAPRRSAPLNAAIAALSRARGGS